MKPDYFEFLLHMDEKLREIRAWAYQYHFKGWGGNYAAFADNAFFCFTPWYQERVIALNSFINLVELLGISFRDHDLVGIENRIRHMSDPEYMKNKEAFDRCIEDLISKYVDYEKEIHSQISKISDFEKERLNEALHCFNEGCYISTISMAVSAIEYKLLKVLKDANPEKDVDGLTLGQLISEYLNHKDEFKNIIPNKHEPLLRLCNQYRIFSVHPLKEKISKNVAQSVLNLSFEFLLDEKLQ